LEREGLRAFIGGPIKHPRWPRREIQMLWLTEYWSSKIAKALGAIGWESRVDPISAAALASLADQNAGSLILFDLRASHEIEKCSYSIPGALLAIQADFTDLFRWVPRCSTVVLFAADTIPAHDARLRLPARKLPVYALEGGLQSWCKAGLPLEPLTLSDRRWVDNR
jgi:hypothetical protein